MKFASRILNTMNINQKLHLVTIIPLVLALTATLIITQMQYQSLSDQVVEVSRQTIINHRKEELINYLSLAKGAIEHVYEDESLSEQQAQQQVKNILANMRFGKDGYFFAYSYDGTAITVTGQEWRVGQNWIDLQDKNGVKIIAELIENAKAGGGYLNYVFNQPSKNGDEGKKLAYAQGLDKWQWMFGTGVYIDYIDERSSRLSNAISQQIKKTSVMTVMIGLISVIVVFISGLFIRISEKRLANIKLRELNGRIFQTQEEECKRVSRELHDGISQTIAAARFSLETAQLKQQNNDDSSAELDQAMSLIRKIMGDIRSISHQLHPGILEDYGLGAALEELGREFSQRTGVHVSVQRLSVRNVLSAEIKVALYRIAQEALTNVERHANASVVNISLSLSPGWLTLKIDDNGQGFQPENPQQCGQHREGIGLRNMKERITFYSGELRVKTLTKGTSVQARIPQSELRYHENKGSKGDSHD
ncbi:cache domain-containing protein [Thalassotalea sp. PLHSN55]|uniref:cache domain-containing protein n=1 Tax=Thalassotalea sp. PLHSN55 TaxID=3435888 RepID=UPI003F831095